MKTEDRVKRVISKHLNVSEIQVTPEADIQKDLGADSLDMVEILMALEDEFEIEIPDYEVEEAKTVGQVLAYLKRRLGPG